MAEAYYIFTDEAGAYNKRPSESFRRSHPFYIRANVRLSASDYRVFQREIQELNTKYGVPVGEENFPHAPCVSAAEVYNNTGGMN